MNLCKHNKVSYVLSLTNRNFSTKQNKNEKKIMKTALLNIAKYIIFELCTHKNNKSII